MSSKSKLQKFNKAVAAERSSCPLSSSTSFQQSIPQQNNLQALHQEQLARLSSVALPKLAAYHSQRFLHLARAQVAANDAMWATPSLHPVQYRRTLWAEDIEPVQTEEKDGKGNKRSKASEGRIVPDFYHKHNPRCRRCALPLVPGLNQLSSKGQESLKKMKRTRSGKRKAECALCRHKTRTA